LPFLREEEAKWGEVGEEEEERGEAADGDAGESIVTVFVTACEGSTFNAGVPSIGCGGMYGVFLRGESEDDDRLFLLLLALLGVDGADAEPPLPVRFGDGDVPDVAVVAVAAAVVLDAGVTGDDESVSCGCCGCFSNVCGGETGEVETGAAESGGGKKLEGSGSCFFAYEKRNKKMRWMREIMRGGSNFKFETANKSREKENDHGADDTNHATRETSYVWYVHAC
jgi:hypothetical protein